MEATSRAHKPLSRTGEWLMLVTQQQSNMENLFLRCVPSMLLDKISSYIQNQWPALAEYAQEMVSRVAQQRVYRAKDWLTYISCPLSTYRIHDLLQALQKTKQNTTVRNMLFQGFEEQDQQIVITEGLRFKATCSKEKGWMCALTRDTIFHLAEAIESHRNWKFLADGLGLQNEEYAKIDNAVDLLDIWMQKAPSATVERLYFEAQELKMQAVCHIIDAIPLEGTPRKNLILHVDADILLKGNVTRFHIAHLNQIFVKNALGVDWHSYMQKFPVYLENVSLYQDNPSDALWQLVDISLSDLLGDLKKFPHLTQHINQFAEEINIGIYDPKSPGGVTLAQVFHLSQADDGLPVRRSEARSLADKLKESWHEFTTSEKSKSLSIFTDIAVDRWQLPLQNKELSFGQFLYLFWQDCEELDLFAFYQLLKAVLKEYPLGRHSNILNNLEVLYDEIVPLRSYDPEIARRNNLEFACRVHEEGLSCINAAADYDASRCIICMDKKREYALAPCGHLAFCATCLDSITSCSYCGQSIERKIRVIVP